MAWKMQPEEEIARLETAHKALVALEGVTLNFALHKHIRELVERLPESIRDLREEYGIKREETQ